MKTLTLCIIALVFSGLGILHSQPSVQWSSVVNTGGLTKNSVSQDNAGNIISAGGNKVVKYNSGGSLLWEMTFSITINDMCTDQSNNVYITGQSGNYNSMNCITIKLDGSGIQQWMATESGGLNLSRYGREICADNSGSVFVSVARTLHNSGNEYYVSTVKYSSAGVKLNEYSENGKWISRFFIKDQHLYVLTNSPLFWNPYTPRYHLSKRDIVNSTGWYVNDTLDATDVFVDNNGNVLLTAAGNSYLGLQKSTVKYNSSGTKIWQVWHSENYNCITADNSGNVYLSGSITTKLGSSGNVIWSQSNNGSAYSIKTDQNGQVFAAGESNGDFMLTNYSPNGAQNWTVTFNSLGGAQDKALDIILNQSNIIVSGICGTSSMGTVKYSQTVGITLQQNGTPEGFMLSQNYPNPFNPSTKISFSLPKASFVKIAVYDITGKEAETLVNMNLAAGTFEVDFDASHLASGIYFCRINAGEFNAVKKMMLTK
jgi:hypothetical protein